MSDLLQENLQHWSLMVGRLRDNQNFFNSILPADFMRFAIAYYKNNTAGKNIVERFKELAFTPQIPVIELKKKTIYCDEITNYPELKEIDLLVFASTHKSEKGNPSLSLHAPGNFRSNDLGGKPGKVSMASSFALKYLFEKLNKNAEKARLNENYEITLEVTHHGPSINIPCIFIEIGSSELQWKDKEAAKVLAKTILSLQDFKPDEKWVPCIGIGGPHYCPNFNKIQLKTDYAISHIIAQYNLPVTETIIKEAEMKTKEQIKSVLIDWKGCGRSEERQNLISLLEKLGLKYKRTSDIEK
ncbi:hypothetical protein GF386_04550 [Candidatus Pacearchaeota archaeon]|nr:hypothetical protein [Candidatus Pacearchaeota archaeon]MBD3283395.1 hypothetical protein [Candidatus Pacearchaeota archaeon]